MSSLLKSSRGDSIPFRQVFDLIGKMIPFTEGVIVSSLPRGGLQIVQPGKLPDAFVKTYTREFHTDDRATWQAVIQQKSLRGSEIWQGENAGSRYLKDFMLMFNLQFIAVAPLQAPVMTGYQGAIHLYRSPEQGDFTDAELQQLADIAKELDEAIEQMRLSRRPTPCTSQSAWAHRPAVRQFIFNSKMQSQIPSADLSLFDERIQQQIEQHGKYRLEHLDEEDIPADRLQVPDSRGDLWTFRVMTYKQYPAFGPGAFLFFCLQPESCDWATVRPTDFQADAEMSRLIPALRFMQQEFHRSPTLGEISRTVHLSPFHFHRRFTELLGLTPKHFLLECQIFEAKRQLFSRQKELVDIATDCGFAHQSHFTSRFKQATGLTPTRWRRLAHDLQRAANN